MKPKKETKLEPPWIIMPEYPMGSMAWRMGAGDTVNREFQRRYRALSDSSKEEFRHGYPEPEQWKGWFSFIETGDVEHLRRKES